VSVCTLIVMSLAQFTLIAALILIKANRICSLPPIIRIGIYALVA